jgi:hypothetical protein
VKRRRLGWPEPDLTTLAWVAHLDVDLGAAQAALRCPPGERPTPPGGVGSRPAPEEWFPGELGGPEMSAGGVSLPAAAPPRERTLVAPEGKALRGAYARRAAVQGR